MQRTVAVLVHPEREEAIEKAAQFIADLHDMGFAFNVFPADLLRLQQRLPNARIHALDGTPAELAVVFGGDGTILRAAEWAHPLGVPLLGVNLGHVGFLAELEPSDIHALPGVVANRLYLVEERLALQVEVRDAAGTVTWT